MDTSLELGVNLLKSVIDYLANPLQTGVYYRQFLVDFSSIEQFVREIAKEPEISASDSKELSKMADSIKEEEYLSLSEITEFLTEALRYYITLKECPNQIGQYLLGRRERVFRGQVPFTPRGHIINRKRISRYHPRNLRVRHSIFDSRILTDIDEVIIIEVEAIERKGKLLFGTTTITEKGSLRFQNFLKCIPHIGDSLQEIRNKKTFSSRYTFLPYPLAVRIWLLSEKAVSIPEDLRDFLKGSMRYHSEEEWRTSIVLSAIAVESVLADLYEEKYRTYAPNVPLGELYSKVKTKITFPPEIMKAIEMVNEARISAVHRSRFPVSDREATNALHGSTKFIMWYSSTY